MKKKTISLTSRGIVAQNNGLPLDIQPDPDPVLKNDGVTIKVLRELTSDAHLFAVMQQRLTGISELSWRIIASKDSDIRFVMEILENLKIAEIIPQIIEAVFYGYTVFEIMWQNISGKTIPVSLDYKLQEWFCFNPENRLRLKGNFEDADKELLDEKFLLVQHRATSINPYGEKILSRCYWPVQYKKAGTEYWLNFTERYGTPFLAAKYKDTATEDEQKALFESVEKMMLDTYGIIPESASLDFISSNSTTSEIFRKFLEFWNTEISKAVISQTLTTEIQNRGSYAASATHDKILEQIIKSDKRLTENAINNLIRKIYQVNFADITEYPIFEMYDGSQLNTAQAERDVILAKTGLKFRPEYFKRVYNLHENDILID